MAAGDALSAHPEIIREKGTDRSRFYRGQVDKYSWRDVGSSFLPSGVLAAFLLEQLTAREQIQVTRRNVFERYEEALADWAAAEGVQLPTIPRHCEQAYHMFYMLMPSKSMAKISNAVELTTWPEVEPLADKLVMLAQDKQLLSPKVRSAVITARENTGTSWLKRRVEWVKELVDQGRKLIAPLALMASEWSELVVTVSAL
jgi:hypothetical protein